MFEYIIALAIILRAYNWFSIFLIRRRNKGPVTLREGMHPFFKKRKGKKVALLIHCFTGSPKEFRQMGEYLAKKGISVYAPLLPGHGTSPEQLVFSKNKLNF